MTVATKRGKTQLVDILKLHRFVKRLILRQDEQQTVQDATQADGWVTASRIADGAVTATKLAADAVEGSKVLNSAINADKLATSAVTSAKIADDAVTTAKINAGAVTTTKLGADAVNGTKIADDAIGSEHIADDAVVAAAIADDAVGSAAIADGAVDAARLATNAVTTVKITDANVTAAKLAADAKVSTMLAVGTSTASVANTTIYASWDTSSSDALADSTNNIVVNDSDATQIDISAAGRYQIDCSFRMSGNNRIEAFCRTWLDTGSGFVRQSMHTASNYSSRDTDQNTGVVTLSTILSLSSGDKLKFQAEADADGTANMVLNGTLLRIIRHP
jgi:hypothetical protein